MTEKKPPTPNQIKFRNKFEPVKTQPPPKPVPAPTNRPPKREEPRRTNGANKKEERKEPFLNPYTFVPAFSRKKTTGALGDAVPWGADRLHEENWTGTIGVTLTVQTPLLLLDTARAANAPGTDEGHLTYPVLLRNGRPHLPATAIKGMLRSAYEAITNSRFGVFTGHDEAPGWRRIVDDAQKMRPVRLSDDEKTLEFWDAVNLPCYWPKKTLKYPGGGVPKHGDHVWVEAVTVQRAEEARDIRRYEDGCPGEGWEEGFVFTTRRNVENKKSERVFVRRSHETEELTERLRDRWQALMEHHRERERDIEFGDYEISPHRESEERRKLAPGKFCWAYRPGNRIEALYPVMIPRDLALRSPDTMVPPKVEPAPCYSNLSPADRVFGWVAQDDGASTRPAAYRGRLRIRDVACVTPTDQAVVRFPGHGLPLAILGQPKPAQGRFYLSRSANEPHRPIDWRTSKNDVHRSSDRALRGRKVYWHHKEASEDETYDAYWNPPAAAEGDPTQELIGGLLFREYVRPNAPSENADPRGRATFETTEAQQRDKQNRSLLGWIGKDTEFTFSIEVRDIPAAELGALLWLLDLEADCHHRLGLGKPLGFGSVHLSLAKEHTKLHIGAQWARYYRELEDELPESPVETVQDACLQAFEEAAQKQPQWAKIRLAFLAIARGRDGIPVHYPRARPSGMTGQRTPPNPAGESYAWFTANEKTSRGNVLGGRGRSLPAPEDPEGRDLDVYTRDHRDN